MIPQAIALVARIAAPMVGRAVAGKAAQSGAGQVASNLAGRATTGTINAAVSKYESRRDNMEQGMSN